MLKHVSSDSYDFGEATIEPIKYGSRGLRGNDLSDFLKRASHSFSDILDRIVLKEGERPVHILAIGATETYGPNRKGDGFKKAACEKYHPTFSKFAMYYRDHDSKDKLKNYGRVVADTFNDDMQRVELIVALNGNEKAASANNGLVADIEQELLDSGRTFDTSMGCKVPGDFCSGCGHFATKVADYCHGSMCKYGGLRTNIGKVFDDGHHLHADNRDPAFYDISGVFRGADRISKGLGYMAKAAGVLVPDDFSEPPSWIFAENLPETVDRQRDILRSLVAMEETMPTKWAGDTSMVKIASVSPVPMSILPQDRGQVWSALSAANVYLPLDEWMHVVAGNGPDVDHAIKLATAALPGVYHRLANDPQLLDKLARNTYTVRGSSPLRLRDWAETLAEGYSLRPEAMRKRAWHSAMLAKQPQLSAVKTASDTADGHALAEQYALYTIGFLDGSRRAGDSNPTSTCTFVLRRSLVN